MCECDTGQATGLRQEPMKWERSIPKQRFTGKFKRPWGQARGDLDLGPCCVLPGG